MSTNPDRRVAGTAPGMPLLLQIDSRYRRAWEAALLLVFAFAVRVLGWWPSVINPDESIFALAAREVVAGHLPYTTLFDNKPVGSTLILAATFLFGGSSILVIRLVGLLFAWASGVLVAALLRSLGFRRAEALVAGAMQIAFVSAFGLGGQATLTELLLTPFTIAAALLLSRLLTAAPRKRTLLALLALLAGLACGMAVLIKMVPILPGVALAITVLLLAVRRGTLGSGSAVGLFLIFVAGAIAPMAIAGLVYAAAGAWDLFAWSNWGFARAYAGVRPSVGTVSQRIATMIDVVWPLLLLSALALARVGVALRRRTGVDDFQVVAMVWLLAELASAAASFQFYPHYLLTAIAPLVVLSAYALSSRARRVGASFPVLLSVSVGAFVTLVAVERSQADLTREKIAVPDVPRRVAASIRRATHGKPPSLFVTNYKLSALYLLTGAPLPPTRFAVPAHLFSRQARMIRADPQREVARVLASRPEFIVLDRAEPLPRWAKMRLNGLSADYSLFRTVGSVQVYRRAA